MFFRIPAWCNDAKLVLNGKELKISCKAGTFVELDRTFAKGDIVDLILPMKVKSVFLPENGVAYERGPIVYSLAITAKTVVKDTKVDDGVTFNSTFKTPLSAWNYAIAKKQEVKVVKSKDFSDPWNPQKTPVKLELNAVALTNWKLYRNTYTPALPTLIEKGNVEQLTLVPLGSTELRITIFPDLLKRFDRAGLN